MSAATRSFQVQRIIEAIAVYCPWTDFISVCHTTSAARAACGAVFFRRILFWISIFLLPRDASYLDKRAATYTFLDNLLLTSAGVVGSVVLALFTVASVEDADLLIDNLNVLVPYDNLREWRELLQRQFGFRLLGAQTPGVEWAGHMHSFLRFIRDGRKVTISTTTSPSILPSVFASRATKQMNVLLRDMALSFYPQLTKERRSVLAWPPSTLPTGAFTDPYDGGSSVPGIGFYRNTAKLGRPCGWECTRIWRAVRGLAHVGQYRFDDSEEFGTHAIGQEKDLIWRIGRTCKNPKCKWRGTDAPRAVIEGGSGWP